MTFQEVLAQVIAWLQREHRVSYRALKRQFNLDDGLQSRTSKRSSSMPNAWRSMRRGAYLSGVEMLAQPQNHYRSQRHRLCRRVTTRLQPLLHRPHRTPRRLSAASSPCCSAT